jgi:hypothetical protein
MRGLAIGDGPRDSIPKDERSQIASEATLSGSRINATLSATGGDWMQMSDDGFWRPHVRAQFVTDDGAVVLMSYTGIVVQTRPPRYVAELPD